MTIGARLRRLREERNLTQQDIEQRTGLLQCYISRVEHGRTSPSLEALERFTEVLRVPLYYLFQTGPDSSPQFVDESGPPGAETQYLVQMNELIVLLCYKVCASSAGSLNVTTRSSSKSWDWGTTKDEAGAVFIITRRFASPPMGSWWLSGTVFPPRREPVISDYRSRKYRPTSSPGARRLRPERHTPHSIATLRILIARHLLRQLVHCPVCGSRGG